MPRRFLAYAAGYMAKTGKNRQTVREAGPASNDPRGGLQTGPELAEDTEACMETR